MYELQHVRLPARRVVLNPLGWHRIGDAQADLGFVRQAGFRCVVVLPIDDFAFFRFHQLKH
jgi:hypothetical protein